MVIFELLDEESNPARNNSPIILTWDEHGERREVTGARCKRLMPVIEGWLLE